MSHDEHQLGRTLKRELDSILFEEMEMTADMKRQIVQTAQSGSQGQGAQIMQGVQGARDARRATEAEQARKKRAWTKPWLFGGVIAAALVLAIGLPMLQQPSPGLPPNSGPIGAPGEGGNDTGSQLSQLIETQHASAEEAKAAFGPEMLAPTLVPEGYALQKIVSSAMKGEAARMVVFFYETADGKPLTFMVDRQEAAFPMNAFTPVDVNGAEGLVYEQPELVELYWMVDGVQYGITGAITAEEALAMAESAA
ncbi:DUF4367 domain-containing protein [Paenibacillus sp. IB182496]|uniref:DUF4367 domain-containing protein n=1 Tax=Paenibacillus sabuli TaxID=2772509 RepID=A0A927BXD8_9BACL|nr:DUF4367 domain-containing protein [Paenibacillus sabuli]MBD2847360.1 DUF4367 domain-containing protein [Paenibacillus sabuli]